VSDGGDVRPAHADGLRAVLCGADAAPGADAHLVRAPPPAPPAPPPTPPALPRRFFERAAAQAARGRRGGARSGRAPQPSRCPGVGRPPRVGMRGQRMCAAGTRAGEGGVRAGRARDPPPPLPCCGRHASAALCAVPGLPVKLCPRDTLRTRRLRVLRCTRARGRANRQVEQPKECRFSPYQNNGGTCLAIAGKDFCIVAADSRLSLGYSILSRTSPKVAQLTSKCCIASSGCQADMITLQKFLKFRMQVLPLPPCPTAPKCDVYACACGPAAACSGGDCVLTLGLGQMYTHQHGKEMQTTAIGQMLATTLYNRRFFPYYTFNVVGGLDETGETWRRRAGCCSRDARCCAALPGVLQRGSTRCAAADACLPSRAVRVAVLGCRLDGCWRRGG